MYPRYSTLKNQVRRFQYALVAFITLPTLTSLAARGEDSAQFEFFEAKIRPVLVEHCYECHNSGETAEAGLALDSRPALLKGGDSGPIVIPGKPDQSRLLAILRHEVEGMEMPAGGPKLDDRILSEFEKWIALGAADPRDQPPSAEEFAAATSWETTLERRKKWWSFQPIKNPAVPGGANNEWSSHPIDGFVYRKLQVSHLAPAPQAEAATLIRRLYFNLTGLPPGADEIAAWQSRISAAAPDNRSLVVDELIDDLLNSPRFGERWARHWMDWIRYAESHGSEGDPGNKNAWYYRDYLIRALNADVSYDQLVREHVAGDLLTSPRINESLGINESAIGPAHWRMVFHGFAPTDALDEKVRFTDDQINAFSKAFLGITVSCARCHNHKFDAISQADYYALFGVLGSCRPGRTVIDLPDRINKNRDELSQLKVRIRQAVAGDWIMSASELANRISAGEGLWAKAENPSFVLHTIQAIQQRVAAGATFKEAWQRWSDGFQKKRLAVQKQKSQSVLHRWNLVSPSDYVKWFPVGAGLPKLPQQAGEFAIAITGDSAITGIYPAGVYTHSLCAKHAARLTSPDFQVEDDSELWVRVLGDAGATVRYVVQNYPRNGTVYPVGKLSPEWKWQKFDVGYWNGDDLHIELTTAEDAPLLTNDQARSWFGVREAVLLSEQQTGPLEFEDFLQPLMAVAVHNTPTSFEDLTQLFCETITAAVQAWRADAATDDQAVLLDLCLRQGLLPNRLESLPSARSLVEEYRQLEEAIPSPTRVPGLDETVAHDQPLFERGNHKLPAETIPRRFLEAIDAKPYKSEQSGRLELADDLLRPDNPLTRRVIVNRVWHHLFGRGIVATPDNLGKLGSQPTHPELLDWLATRFAQDEWSLKRLIRFIVTSKTWQLSSQPSAEALQRDPENLYLSHASVRRLEAEAIRDAMLTTSNRIQHEIGGPPAAGSASRRSVYVRVLRNSLDPFLRTFDFPEPFSAVGRRDVTNVPAQSLALMNSVQVADYADAWAQSVLRDQSLTSDQQRIERMFLSAFGRQATKSEVTRTESYLADTASFLQNRKQQMAELHEAVAKHQLVISSLTQPVRERLTAESGDRRSTIVKELPTPISQWDFDGSADDAVGAANAELRNGASVRDGALVVADGGHAVTALLSKTIREKTLQAWVQLDRLDQRAGGVMTIQTPNGVVFDSIVFAEKNAQRWLAGSNGFSRTTSFDGPPETTADREAVHIAIAYHADGRIVGYRNGQLYGKSYVSTGPHEYTAGNAVVSFGVRHLPATGGRMLSGKILKAQLFDRALSDEEIAASADASMTFVSDKQIMAELSEVDRETVQQLRRDVETIESQIEGFGPVSATEIEQAVWSDLARALFMFKEFIYVR